MYPKAGFSIHQNASPTVNSEPLQSPSEVEHCESCAIELTGWPLVATWVALVLCSWAMLYGFGVGIYKLVMWIAP